MAGEHLTSRLRLWCLRRHNRFDWCKACLVRSWHRRPALCGACAFGNFVVVAVLLAVASGCSSHQPAGTVAGQYRLVGGPAPGVNQPEPATIWAFAGHVDLSQMSQAKVTAHTNTDASGHFTLSLNPGEYTLFGSQGLSSSVATDGCGAPVDVEVKASARTSVDLVCSVP